MEMLHLLSEAQKDHGVAFFLDICPFPERKSFCPATPNVR